MNISKSECFPLNPAAKQIPSFHLASSSFRYLGINISHSLSSLYKLNFLKLVKEMKSDLKRWNALPLSLLGRINSIKMNMLPRFSFLFQCLPLFLFKSFFKDLDKAFSSFIWAGKTPREKYSILQRSKEDGGLALPSLLSFYWAANIQKIHTWHNYPATDWCQIEAHSCGSISLSALIDNECISC